MCLLMVTFKRDVYLLVMLTGSIHAGMLLLILLPSYTPLSFLRGILACLFNCGLEGFTSMNMVACDLKDSQVCIHQGASHAVHQMTQMPRMTMLANEDLSELFAETLRATSDVHQGGLDAPWNERTKLSPSVAAYTAYASKDVGITSQARTGCQIHLLMIDQLTSYPKCRLRTSRSSLSCMSRALLIASGYLQAMNTLKHDTRSCRCFNGRT